MMVWAPSPILTEVARRFDVTMTDVCGGARERSYEVILGVENFLQ